jgi:hypothetical protein
MGECPARGMAYGAGWGCVVYGCEGMACQGSCAFAMCYAALVCCHAPVKLLTDTILLCISPSRSLSRSLTRALTPPALRVARAVSSPALRVKGMPPH